MNRIIISGRVVKDPELRMTAGKGTPVGRFFKESKSISRCYR